MTDDNIKAAEEAGADDKDTFLAGDDAPNYRAGDGTFVPHPDAPEFPKSNGLPAHETADTAPEFRMSDGVTELEGGAATKLPVAEENTTDEPVYAEHAVGEQTTKEEAAENDAFNHKEDIPVQAEYAKGVDRAVKPEDALDVDADKDNLGEPLSNNAVAPGPDAAADKAKVEAENAEKDQALVDKQLQEGGTAKGEDALELTKPVDTEAREKADAEDVASKSTVSDEKKAKVAEKITDSRKDGFDAEAKEKADTKKTDETLKGAKKHK